MQQLAHDVIVWADEAPGDVAVVDAAGAHAVKEIAAAAQGLAAQLSDGLTGAPTVLVQADNSWRTLVAAVAIGLRGGLVGVISSHATRSEYELAVEDLRPDAVLADPLTLDTWHAEDAFPASVPSLDGWRLSRVTSGVASGVARWQGGAVVAMTSGSTGRPKCVVQSEAALRYAGDCTVEAVGLEPGDPVGALVPLSSVAAFCFGMYLPASRRSPMVCLDRWKPDDAVALLRDNAVAWTMLVPTMALQLSLVPGSEGALSSLKAMTVGGGPMNLSALKQAEEHLGTTFLRVFGMSECLGHTTPLPSDPPDVRLGCDGRPFPGTVVRVVDETGVEVPTGETGHAQVRGPSMFTGYARNGEPQPPDLTADGFLATGDLARVNADGTLTILGRQKQVIIRGGRNIDINEVEAALAAIPGVAQVCVVPVPDDLMGERVAALVVSIGAALTIDEVREHLESLDFPKFKWPEYVFSVHDLPQNRVGKLNRVEAVSMATHLTSSQGTDKHRVTSG